MAAGRVVEIEDERSGIAAQALGLILETFASAERQPIDHIGMEIGEKRLGLSTACDYHLLAVVDPDAERVLAVTSGVYLGGVNAGFVMYLAVERSARKQRLGRTLRVALVDRFREDAQKLGWPSLAAVVGEVRRESPWLRRLVRDRDVLPLDLNYYHPGEVPSQTPSPWLLYRQPIADDRAALPAGEVRQLIYAIWRRAYRVRWPLTQEGFFVMLEELAGRDQVGADPRFAAEEGAS